MAKPFYALGALSPVVIVKLLEPSSRNFYKILSREGTLAAGFDRKNYSYSAT